MEVWEGMCSTYLVPTVSLLILLLSMTALWELLKEERSGWTTRATGLQSALMKMCWATSQRGVIPSMERGPSLQLIAEYQQEMHYSFLSKASRCSFQLRRGPFVTFVCVCVCVCLQLFVFSTAIYPSLPSLQQRALSSPIVSIQLAAITNGSLITEFIWLAENNGGSKLSFSSPILSSPRRE